MRYLRCGGAWQKNRGRIGAYSAVPQRGVIGDNIDGPLRDGRLARHIAAELLKHLGGNVSFVEKLLIERFIKTKLGSKRPKRKAYWASGRISMVGPTRRC